MKKKVPRGKKYQKGQNIGPSFNIMTVPIFSETTSKAIKAEEKKWEDARKRQPERE